MGADTGFNFSTILNLIFGPGGVLLVGVYIFYLGMQGRWMFASVHEKIVAQLEQRLADAVAFAAKETARADAWQQRYLDSRDILDRQTNVAATAIEHALPTGNTGATTVLSSGAAT